MKPPRARAADGRREMARNNMSGAARGASWYLRGGGSEIISSRALMTSQMKALAGAPEEASAAYSCAW